jgi:hypothetical protein
MLAILSIVLKLFNLLYVVSYYKIKRNMDLYIHSPIYLHGVVLN